MASRPYAAELDIPEPEPPVGRSRGEGGRGRDPIYLFACHVEWRDRRNLRAYNDLIAALDDRDQSIRVLAETLLHRSSPQPKNQVGRNDTVNPQPPREQQHASRN